MVRRKNLIIRLYRVRLLGLNIPSDLNLKYLATPLGLNHRHMMRSIGTQKGSGQHHVAQCGGKTDPGQGATNDCFHSMHECLQLLASLTTDKGMELIHHQVP